MRSMPIPRRSHQTASLLRLNKARMTDEVKTYETAGAERTDLQRLRRQAAFDRFLARMFFEGT
jgi:hypothetical protein